MSLEQNFQKAVQDVRKLKAKPTDQELLEVYALFKQSSDGDCNTARPGMLDLKGKAKWDAWNGKKGMSKDEAKAAYVSRVNALVETYGVS
ncbi:acyl-CoA-binding protein homolog isoform X2 [Oppia nitens]|uniref:acyl-CoA-binding protein homolog isoform X2 n=1 Tax=Oppia nitens TaxID=1686743 RepID=UPI0023DA22E6|nr:acyl-CoA-binding protein homolog isoform X2 [Oppia nitens]XP_054168773.1 acyl-CoA-binding protein homolog isoform X2 [Oppia nitens]